MGRLIRDNLRLDSLGTAQVLPNMHLPAVIAHQEWRLVLDGLFRSFKVALPAQDSHWLACPGGLCAGSSCLTNTTAYESR